MYFNLDLKKFKYGFIISPGVYRGFRIGSFKEDKIEVMERIFDLKYRNCNLPSFLILLFVHFYYTFSSGKNWDETEGKLELIIVAYFPLSTQESLSFKVCTVKSI